MEKGKKGIFSIIFGRTTYIIISLILQILFLLSMFKWLEEYVIIVYSSAAFLSTILVIYIINERSNPAFKLAWIVPVLVLPVFGSLLFLFVQLQIGTKLINAELRSIIKQTKPYLEQDNSVIESLKSQDNEVYHLANYMNNYGGYPTYSNTDAKFFPLGEDKFAEMLVQLESAEKFIFMEYFIVEEGIMWNTILEILERKVKQGVEVRFMYDGMCSLILLPYKYPEKLKSKGIKCKMFSPIKPILSTHQNNRDHRKILVVDGKVAFTGGVNLADEYINKKVRFGHWKDTAVMITGDAVKSFTIMFLQMWNITERTPEDYNKYIDISIMEYPITIRNGYTMPYADSPLDKENVGEQVYMDILYTAKDYVHIMTPYLILDNEMIVALTYAVKRGIDVKIIMPHIPDKWYAFVLAKTYYRELIDAGVKIYEYTPGFVHAKVFVSDNIKATVGTINLDFRSLYLHFECGVFLYKNSVVSDIEKDFQNTLKCCHLVTVSDCNNRKLIDKLAGRLLRIFAPLM